MIATIVTSGSDVWQIAGWTMLHFLWIGLLLGAVAAAAKRAIGQASPELRYGVAIVFLIAQVVAPIVIFVWLLRSEPTFEPTIAAPPPAEISIPAPAMPATAMPASVHVPPPPLAPLAFSQAPVQYVSELFMKAAFYAPWVWLIGTPLTLLFLLTGILGANRLRRQSRILTEGPLVDLCQQIAEPLGVARRVAIGVSEHVVSPLVLGVLRPVILVPPSMVTGWTTEQTEMILLHELAHIRRWDNLVNLAQRLVESVLFFQPAVWWVSSWVRLEREHCCDAVVLRCGGEPQAYAETLASLAIPGISPAHAAAVMANHQLVSRIRHILNVEDRTMTLSGKSLAAVLALVVTAGGIVVGFAQQPGATAEVAAETADPTPIKPEEKAAPKVAEATAIQEFTKTYAPTAFVDTGTVDVVEPKVTSFIDWTANTVNVTKPSWGPEQATGAPDSASGPDQATAWASLSEDGQDEWLELTYAEPVDAVAVLVFENHNPGAVAKVTVRDAEKKGLTYTWSRGDSTGGISTAGGRGVALIPLDARLKTKEVRIDIDSKNVKGWNEIDAVGLLDSQGKTHFATGATASSTFADQASTRWGATQAGADPRWWVAEARPSANVRVKAYGIRSSEKRGWSAAQAAGPPDVTQPGDNRLAWASATADGQAEWLEVTFDPPAHGAALLVYESFNPGAVRSVQCFDASGANFVTRPKRESVDANSLRPLVVPLDTPMKIQRVRLEIDSQKVPGWNEIDAVGLVDHTVDKIRWASSAKASSSYGDPPAAGNPNVSIHSGAGQPVGDMLELIRMHQPDVPSTQCVRCHAADHHGKTGAPRTIDRSLEQWLKAGTPSATSTAPRTSATLKPTPVDVSTDKATADLVARLHDLKNQWEQEKANQAAQKAELQARTQQLQTALDHLRLQLQVASQKAQTATGSQTAKEQELLDQLKASQAKIKELEAMLRQLRDVQQKQKPGGSLAPPSAKPVESRPPVELPAAPGGAESPPADDRSSPPKTSERIGSRTEVQIAVGHKAVVSTPGFTFKAIEHVNRDVVDSAIAAGGSRLEITAKAAGKTSVEVSDTDGIRHLVVITIVPAAESGKPIDGKSETRPADSTTGAVRLPRYLDLDYDNRVKAYEEAFRRQAEIKAGIKDGGEIDRATLIRRLYLDVLGVPPTPDEVKAFVDDPRPTAAEHLLEQLLKTKPKDPGVVKTWFDAIKNRNDPNSAESEKPDGAK